MHISIVYNRSGRLMAPSQLQVVLDQLRSFQVQHKCNWRRMLQKYTIVADICLLMEVLKSIICYRVYRDWQVRPLCICLRMFVHSVNLYLCIFYLRCLVNGFLYPREVWTKSMSWSMCSFRCFFFFRIHRCTDVTLFLGSRFFWPSRIFMILAETGQNFKTCIKTYLNLTLDHKIS